MSLTDAIKWEKQSPKMILEKYQKHLKNTQKKYWDLLIGFK